MNNMFPMKVQRHLGEKKSLQKLVMELNRYTKKNEF